MRRVRFAEFVRRQAVRRGRQGLADLVGVSASTIGRLSTGGLPTIGTLRQVCAAVKTPPDLFIEEFCARIRRP